MVSCNANFDSIFPIDINFRYEFFYLAAWAHLAISVCNSFWVYSWSNLSTIAEVFFCRHDSHHFPSYHDSHEQGSNGASSGWECDYATSDKEY